MTSELEPASTLCQIGKGVAKSPFLRKLEGASASDAAGGDTTRRIPVSSWRDLPVLPGARRGQRADCEDRPRRRLLLQNGGGHVARRVFSV